MYIVSVGSLRQPEPPIYNNLVQKFSGITPYIYASFKWPSSSLMRLIWIPKGTFSLIFAGGLSGYYIEFRVYVQFAICIDSSHHYGMQAWYQQP